MSVANVYSTSHCFRNRLKFDLEAVVSAWTDTQAEKDDDALVIKQYIHVYRISIIDEYYTDCRLSMVMSVRYKVSNTGAAS